MTVRELLDIINENNIPTDSEISILNSSYGKLPVTFTTYDSGSKLITLCEWVEVSGLDEFVGEKVVYGTDNVTEHYPRYYSIDENGVVYKHEPVYRYNFTDATLNKYYGMWDDLLNSSCILDSVVADGNMTMTVNDCGISVFHLNNLTDAQNKFISDEINKFCTEFDEEVYYTPGFPLNGAYRGLEKLLLLKEGTTFMWKHIGYDPVVLVVEKSILSLGNTSIVLTTPHGSTDITEAEMLSMRSLESNPHRYVKVIK